ncbi:MAG: hypothetical protein IPM29_27690 [Planctomycetes bacterium]|nr:hypothetical protein [Planctomycetota bacterium]
MATLLDLGAARALTDIDARAATDVTGFRLADHGREMADAANLSLEIDARVLPVFDGTAELVRAGRCGRRATRGHTSRSRRWIRRDRHGRGRRGRHLRGRDVRRIAGRGRRVRRRKRAAPLARRRRAVRRGPRPLRPSRGSRRSLHRLAEPAGVPLVV